MEKINFSNGEKISAAKVTIDNVDYEVTPAVYDGATPLNATVFNNMQENIEDAIDEKADSEDVYTKQEVNALIPTKVHQINVGEVDTEYRVNLLKTKNLFDKKTIVAGDVKGDNSSIRLSSRQVQYIEAGTYTISSDLPLDTYNYGFQIVKTPPPRANYDALYNTNWLNVGSYTFTISVNGYILVNVRKADNSSLSVSEIANYNFYLTKGSTATTDDFIPNQINVDNEKYSDTINVGAIEDSRSRVNVLHSKNLIKPTLATTTQNGVTCTNNGDGTYTLNGTATDVCQFNIITNLNLTGTYKLSGCPSSGSQSTYYMFARNASWSKFVGDIGEGKVGTFDSTMNTLAITVANGITCNNVVFKPMITENLSSSYADFEPYIVPSIKVDNEEIYAKPEIGTNENGSYIKYANGLMICSGVKSFTGTNFTTQNGAVYIPASSPSINFAQQFIENPVVTLTAFNRANGVYESGLSTSLVAIWPFAFSSISNVNYSIHYIAIGKWK